MLTSYSTASKRAATFLSSLLGCSLTNKIKKHGKDKEGIRSSTTPDPGYHMGK